MEIQNCVFDEAAFYDVENHVWLKPSGEDMLIGLDAIILWLTGPLRSLTLPKQNTVLQKGKVLGSLESARHFDVIRSPISCIIREINSIALNNPITVNKDPYNSGWLARITPLNTDELKLLKRAEEASSQLEQMIKNFRIHCFKEFPDYELYEIGIECSAALVRLNDLLAKSEPGTVVHIVTDDPLADIEIIRWADQTGNTLVESRNEGNLKHFLVKKRV
jgi:glycine cleavage system H lipoate-binding protein/TusA-related sulfurtransferase